jgi:hypothetical protein
LEFECGSFSPEGTPLNIPLSRLKEHPEGGRIRGKRSTLKVKRARLKSLVNLRNIIPEWRPRGLMAPPRAGISSIEIASVCTSIYPIRALFPDVRAKPLEILPAIFVS